MSLRRSDYLSGLIDIERVSPSLVPVERAGCRSHESRAVLLLLKKASWSFVLSLRSVCLGLRDGEWIGFGCVDIFTLFIYLCLSFKSRRDGGFKCRLKGL